MPFGLENGMGEVAARTSFQYEWPGTFFEPDTKREVLNPALSASDRM
jgi:hypothetical protein